MKVTHYATIAILELAFVVYSPNTSRNVGNVQTTGGSYTSICWEGTVFEIRIIHSRYISLVVYIYITLHVCVVVKHYSQVVVAVVIIRRLFIADTFDLGQVYVGLVAGRVAQGQVLRRDFCFPKQ